MIARVVSWSARHPGLVLFVAALVAVASYITQRSLARDVIPDLSDPQIVLVAEWMGHPATDVARDVTEVLTRSLEGVPGTTAVRGSSMTGMAYIDVSFGEESSLSRARTEIVRRVESLRAKLPPNARVLIGPEASSTGWIFQYALIPPPKRTMPMGRDERQGPVSQIGLRKFQDEVLRPALSRIPGVAEVAAVGGENQEVLIQTTPDQLRGAGAAFSDVVGALAGVMKGAHPSVAQLENAGVFQGKRVKDVARVRVVPAMANAATDLDGGIPAVGGIVIARRNADIAAVVAQVKQVLDRERTRLPSGVKLGVLYDRSLLAGRIEQTLFRAVAEEMGVVALVVLLFLLHWRSALIPLVTLPFVVLLTFAAMRCFGVPATIMSLGGIAIALGMAVDADLVALEACHRRLEARQSAGVGGDPRVSLIAAAGSFAPAILISLVIAALAFIPVFAFGGETGRLLTPLALTKTLVIGAAALVTLTLAPALRDRLLGSKVVPELGNPVTRWLVRAYRPFVHFALSRPAFTVSTAVLIALSSALIVPRLGSEFLPRIDEGDLLYMPTTLPGVSAEDAALDLHRQDVALALRPEVATAFGKVGRADTATDPAPFSMAETLIHLAPRSELPQVARHRWYSTWAPPRVKRVLAQVWPEETPPTTDEIIESLDRATRLPGWTNAWTAPVRARSDMMSTGVHTPVGVRVVADDPRRLEAIGSAVQGVVSRVSGTRSAVFESLGGQTRLTFALDRAETSRRHVDDATARALAELLLSGGQLGQIRAADAGVGTSPVSRPLAVRISLDAPWLAKPAEDVLRDATVRSTDAVSQVPLAFLGRTSFASVPAMLRSEHGHRAAYVYVDLSAGTDIAGYIDRARTEVDRAVGSGEIRLGPGERIEWTGQYQLLASGERRLKVIAPIVAVVMLGLLLLQFRSLIEALIVLVSVPFALVGSFWTLYLLGYPLSAPVWVGLLSVVGLAMQTGVVMVVYIDEAYHRRLRDGLIRSREDIIEAHAEGTVRRLRPKLMTITTMAAALLPLLWAQGSGAEIMRRVAAPMIGGLVTSAFLTLEVIPVLYTMWRAHQLAVVQRTSMPVPAVALDAE